MVIRERFFITLTAFFTTLAAPALCLVPRPTPTTSDKKVTVTVRKRTVVIYIQACNNLESFAYRNLADIVAQGATSDTGIVIELHKPGAHSWRYSVETKQTPQAERLVTRQVLNRHSHAKPCDEVVDTMRWAKEICPAEKYALIFWNHGYGVIDPDYSEINQSYAPNSRTFSRATTNQIASDRGILFDDDRKRYLTNPEMLRAFKEIKENVLGQKIDVLGMDACLMGMKEVAYQVKDHVNHLVTSQEFEFAQGWPYGQIVKRLNEKPAMSGQEMCDMIVDEYDKYYRNKTGYFTQSSINITHMQTLEENVSNVARLLLELKAEDGTGIQLLIKRARSQCQSFSMPDYRDLHSFYVELKKLVMNILTQPAGTTTSPPPPKVSRSRLEQLRTHLDTGIALITNSVVSANTAGPHLNRARGISIYFPQNGVHPSYTNTEFAKNSAWSDLLHSFTAHS